MVKGKHESLGRLRNYLSHMLEVEGVNVVTGQEVDAAFVREQSPDVVIVATGGVRPELAAAGSSATPVIGVTDFLASEIGDHVAVLGFNAQATDTAHYLIAQGKKVTVIAPEPAEAFGTGQSMMLNAFVKPAFFAAGGRLMPECTLKSVGDGEIVVTNGFGMDITLACDCVVDASTMSPNTALARRAVRRVRRPRDRRRRRALEYPERYHHGQPHRPQLLRRATRLSLTLPRRRPAPRRPFPCLFYTTLVSGEFCQGKFLPNVAHFAAPKRIVFERPFTEGGDGAAS